ncbi:hypothetical protein ACJX0J_029254, partial [Zea mays]
NFGVSIILKANFALNLGREYYMQGTWFMDILEGTVYNKIHVFMWLVIGYGSVKCLCEEFLQDLFEDKYHWALLDNFNGDFANVMNIRVE